MNKDNSKKTLTTLLKTENTPVSSSYRKITIPQKSDRSKNQKVLKSDEINTKMSKNFEQFYKKEKQFKSMMKMARINNKIALE